MQSIKVLIVQDREVYRFENCLYRTSLNEFEKFEKDAAGGLDFKVIMYANIIELTTLNTSMIKLPQFVEVVEFRKKSILDKLHLSGNNVKVLENAIAKVDLVVIKQPLMFLGTIACNLSKKLKKKYLVDVVGCGWDVFWYYSILGKLLAPINYIMMRRNIAQAPLGIYVTKKFLQHRYPTNGVTLGCSDVNLAPLSDEILTKRLDKISSLNDIVHLKIGTLSPVDIRFRGQEFVIKAISTLKGKGYIFEYYLVGGGDSTYLENLAKKHNIENQIHFVGKVAHNKVFDFLDSLDLYIHPSMAEGMPRAVIEAISRALPTLGAKTGGIPELLNEECVFEKGNVAQIVTALSSLSKKKLAEYAVFNFQVAKGFQKDVLDNKRAKYFKEILE